MPLDLLFTVDTLPRPGEKIDGRGLVMQGGGPVPNVMIGLSRLGFSTALITAIGNDQFGRLGTEALEIEGVTTDYLVHKRGPSDIAIGLIEAASGRRTMVLNRVIHVAASDITPTRYPRPRLVHLDGRDMPATLKLARWARRVGAIVSFDIGSIRNDVSAVFPLVDHLVVADSFALPFTGKRSVRAALRALQRHCPGTVVITAGRRGAVGIEAGRTVEHPAFPVKAVDTTGAGDAFHTGYLLGVLEGRPLPERLRLGAAVAAIKCLTPGARAGLPDRRRLRTFLSRRSSRHARHAG